MAHWSKQFLFHTTIAVIAALVTLASLIVFPFLYTYRLLVRLCAKANSNLGDILDDIGTILADDSLPSRAFIIGILKLDGNITCKEIEFAMGRVLKMRTKSSNKLRYPQLQQHAENFMGYWFWKNDINFELRNHIKAIKMPLIANDQENCSQIHQKMVNLSLPEKQSPWEIVIVEHSSEQVSSGVYVVLRVHHCMMDSKSFLKLVVEGLGQKPIVAALPRTTRNMPSFWYMIPCLPYHMAVNNYKCLLYKHRSMGHPFRAHPEDNTPINVRQTKQISMELLKNSVTKFGNHRPSSVIMAVVYRAYEQFMKNSKLGHTLLTNIPILFTMPKDKHPETFANHCHTGFLERPSDNLSKMELFAVINQQYTDQRERIIEPFCFEINSKIVTSLPQLVRKSHFVHEHVNMGLTNIAGEKQTFFLEGRRCMDFSLSVGLLKSTIGVAFVVCSYKNNFRISLVARSSCIPEALCDEFLNILEIGFDDLLNIQPESEQRE